MCMSVFTQEKKEAQLKVQMRYHSGMGAQAIAEMLATKLKTVRPVCLIVVVALS